ncbi:MAG: lactate utilization protein [Oscillospiraceae bacterium]|nr:lactate utilization protein [Oscillospiraceae bacterium]
MMDLEKTVSNLKSRGFGVSCFLTAEEAVDYLSGQISGVSVGIGGSKTVDQIGLYDRLCENNEVFWHWKNSAPDTRQKANAADIYISSANAISEDGEILNIDGMGNRLAGQIWGHKKVYIVSGTNKICPDFESALFRARNIAAVENCKRFANNQPCQIDGKCHDCRVPSRVCRALLVLWEPMMGMETEIVLIDQELGM